MADVSQQPYGTWESPLASEALARGGVRFGAVEALPSGDVLWLETRPQEQGRTVLVRGRSGVAPVDLVGDPWSVRSSLHEYGGRPYWTAPSPEAGDRGPVVVFANEADQRLYRLDPDGSDPVPLTPEPKVAGAYRYANGMVHPDGRMLVCVREDHHGRPGRHEPANELVVVPMDGSAVDDTDRIDVVVTGPDFVISPAFSPDGTWLSWVQWDHPNMPWLATELCVAPWNGGENGGENGGDAIGAPRVVASGVAPTGDGVQGESIHGAGWTSAGDLVFSSDRNGWWNLYSWQPGRGEGDDDDDGVRAITAVDLAEIGGPAWEPETKRWAELVDGRLMAVVTTDAIDSVALIDDDGGLHLIDTPDLTGFGSSVAAGANGLVATAVGPAVLSQIVEVVPDGEVLVHRPPIDLGIDAAWFSRPEPISFDKAHAFLYRPTAPGIEGPDGDKPPLIVICHGGPTAHTSPVLDLKIQFWTTRGFAVVDVNYRGSSGFGRAYRDALLGRWGVVDVEDCVAAARYLAAAGRVDPDRMVIRGSSSGGLTVLLALMTSDVFAAGTSLYGVADLAALAADTHKFESRYLDGLVGRWPEDRAIFDERSPINRTEELTTPMLVMQGTDDKVVPPSQSEAVVAALAANGVDHTYIEFAGEGHGFRKAENMIRAMDEELAFYQRILSLRGPL